MLIGYARVSTSRSAAAQVQQAAEDVRADIRRAQLVKNWGCGIA